MKEFVLEGRCSVLESYLNGKAPPTGSRRFGGRYRLAASVHIGKVIPYGISLVNVRKALTTFGPHGSITVRAAVTSRGRKYPVANIMLHG